MGATSDEAPVVDPHVDLRFGAFSASTSHRRSHRPLHTHLRQSVAERGVAERGVAERGVAERVEQEAQRRVSAERQRIAGALHDEVGPLLFAIAAAVQRAQILHTEDPDELLRTVSRVGDQVLAASDKLREVLGSCTPIEPAEGVPAAAQRDLEDLAERSGIDTHLLVRGHARALAPRTERVALSCLRQALFNIERHAGARTVIVTLDYAPNQVVLVIQDDGRGLPAGFEPRVVPQDGHHWGFSSMARQVEQRGGELELDDDEDGGTRLRVRLPG